MTNKQTVDKQTTEDIIVYGLGESLLICDDNDFRFQIENLSQDKLEKYLDEDNTPEDIKNYVLKRRTEMIPVWQKEKADIKAEKLKTVDATSSTYQPVKTQYVDEFDRLMHMPDSDFKKEIAYMSDMALIEYLKKETDLVDWERAQVKGRWSTMH